MHVCVCVYVCARLLYECMDMHAHIHTLRDLKITDIFHYYFQPDCLETAPSLNRKSSASPRLDSKSLGSVNLIYPILELQPGPSVPKFCHGPWELHLCFSFSHSKTFYILSYFPRLSTNFYPGL